MEPEQNKSPEQAPKTVGEKVKAFAEMIKSMTRAVAKSLKFSFTYVPLTTTVNIISQAVSAVIPFVVLYNWQTLINELTQSGITTKVWTCVVFYAAITVFQLALNTFVDYVGNVGEKITDRKLMEIRANKMSGLDMGKYDDPEFADAMSVLDNTPWYSNITRYFVWFVRDAVALGIAFPRLFKIYPAASVLILAFYIPTIIITCKKNIAVFKLYESEYRDRRRSLYYREILTERNYAQERKLYGYDNLIKGKYRLFWEKLYKNEMDLYRKNMKKSLLAEGVKILGMVALFIFLTVDMINGRLLPGSVALYIGLGDNLMGSASSLGYNFSYLHNEYQQCDGKFEKFLALESTLDEKGTLKMADIPEIEFKNVSFKYPGKDVFALKNLSFKIQKGEKLALVGVNGAGKTTLTKLLMRIYDPSEGEILFDGIPAKEYDINSLRSIFSVTFQSCIRYSMTFKENITISDVENYDEERFQLACRMSGADEIAKSLKEGYDTPVSRYFDDDGFEPSGGQKQKIGLARAFYRGTGFIILDEPSSALDAEAEDHIFNQFITLCRDKSALLISHRMSAVIMTDKIAMIENGELLEFGTHRELMDNNGRYAQLYNMQADRYREGIADENKND